MTLLTASKGSLCTIVRPDPEFRAEMLKAVPRLRAFAFGLTGDHHRADDLVQDTLLRAWEAADRFEPGTNLLAWLYTILRNRFLSEYRSRRHQVDDPDGKLVERLSVLPSQDNRLDYLDLRRALAQLAPEHREALLLVGAEGLPLGKPLRSRVCRLARSRAASTEPAASWQSFSAMRRATISAQAV